VANECRNLWGDRFFTMPACRAWRRSSFQKPMREKPEPRGVTKSAFDVHALITKRNGLIASEDAQSNGDMTYATITAQIPAAQLDAIRESLRTGGRTLAQGAIGWLWARSPATVPIPGFRTVEQVEVRGAVREVRGVEVQRALRCLVFAQRAVDGDEAV
jgi:aryl-alcohol dehydrogenase-like predicted oxidoreductase